MTVINPDAIRTYGKPPATPEDALAHVLCALTNLPDDYMLIQATNDLYGDGARTGLTKGDLKAIQRQLDNAERPTDADIVQFPTRP
jgi:hypothetical protein